jgi:Rha family phage regulatory protein
MNLQLRTSLSNSQALTMSSVEIAELTGKRHGNVIRDIEAITSQLEKDSSTLSSGFKSSTYAAGNGKQEKCYELTQDASVMLMTGYSVPMRAKLVLRWRELESKNIFTLPDFTNPAEAARAWAFEYDEKLRAELARDEAIRTKAEIGSRREASAMGKASAAAKKVKKLEQVVTELEVKLDTSKDWATIRKMQIIHPSLAFNWRLLKKTALALGEEIKSVPDDIYESVNAYSRKTWQEAYNLEINPA